MLARRTDRIRAFPNGIIFWPTFVPSSRMSKNSLRVPFRHCEYAPSPTSLFTLWHCRGCSTLVAAGMHPRSRETRRQARMLKERTPCASSGSGTPSRVGTRTIEQQYVSGRRVAGPCDSRWRPPVDARRRRALAPACGLVGESEKCLEQAENLPARVLHANGWCGRMGMRHRSHCCRCRGGEGRARPNMKAVWWWDG